MSILPNTDSLQLGRSYTARLCLISGATHPTASAAGDQLVRAHHLNSFYKFPPNLLHRRPSHNYCLSGTHRTTALTSSSLPIFDRRDATVPTSRSCLGRHYLFLCRNKLSRSMAATEFSLISVGRQRKTAPTEIRNSCRAEFPCFGAHSQALKDFATDFFVFCFLFFTEPVAPVAQTYLVTL